ncbi:MAG: acyl-ACP--UDP-N-acetylglucosamine O-acyltransferase [Deltaproteobacteria bacterium]|nr:acyl-ACP--UDP-N-acetylglucosamine O-acyltransferase [Deltaproteobacteria bacterium]
MAIHPTALIDRQAEIDPSAEIGPYVVIEGAVVVGAGTQLHPYVHLMGPTTLGRDNVIGTGAALGGAPQDLSYRGAPTALRIGDRNQIREHVEISRATKLEHPTTLGDDNFLMGHSHVGHDCQLGNGVILANGAMLGGHVHVGDRAFVSGNCVVHQFVRVGRLTMLRGLSRTSRDVPPFAIMDWTHTVRGINRVGLRRAGFSGEAIRAVQRAFATLFGSRRNLRQALAEVEAGPRTPEVDEVLAFIRASTRGVCFGPAGGAVGED